MIALLRYIVIASWLVYSVCNVSSNADDYKVYNNVDLHWVLQGFDIGFSGFFVEFLGYSSAIKSIFPQSRFMKSSFKYSFDESDFTLSNLLFEKEKLNLEILMSSNNSINYHTLPKPKSLVFGELPLPPDSYCSRNNDIVNNHNPVLEQSRVAYIGGNIARYSVNSILSAEECCKNCLNHPLCVSWTFQYESSNCLLKNEYYLPKIPSDNFESGNFNLNGKGKLIVPKVIVFHGTTCVYQNKTVLSSHPDINTILIGRYMSERSRITGGFMLDDCAVLSCAALVDEIWVPSHYHLSAFKVMLKDMGFNFPSIAVIPESVDTELFDPSLVSSSRFVKYQINDNNCELNKESSGNTYCIDETSDETFEFLSIFKWERRKGWDILLDSYFNAFTEVDNVVLRIRTYIPNSDHLTDRNLTRLVETFCTDLNLNRSCPRVLVEGYTSDTPKATRIEMREIYASADTFVLPTRGEGWGLPIAEAMAMELPVIVTNCSGITEYANGNNSYLIPTLAVLDHLSFSQPDKDELIKLMRQAVFDSKYNDVARQKGIEARKTMKKFSPHYTVGLMAERIKYHMNLRGWDTN